MMILILASLGCTLVAVGLALWQNGNARAWARVADAAQAEVRRLQFVLGRTVPRQPALTIVAPQYHAPLAARTNLG